MSSLSGFCFGGSLGLLYGIDHILLDHGIRREGVHESAEAQQAKEGKDKEGGDQPTQENDQYGEHTGQKCHTQQSHDVALEAHDRKDQSVFQDFGGLHVEGDHHEVGVETHDTVNEDQGEDHEVHDVVTAGGGGVPEVEQVKAQGEQSGAIDDTHDKALLQVAADSVEVVRDHENAVTAHQIAQNVGGTGSLPAVGDDLNDRQSGHDPVGPGIEHGGLVHESRRAVEQGHAHRSGSGGLGTQERRVERTVQGRDLGPREIQERDEEQRDDLHHHHQIEGDQLPELPSPELEKPLEGGGGVLPLFHALTVPHGVKELEFLLLFDSHDVSLSFLFFVGGKRDGISFPKARPRGRCRPSWRRRPSPLCSARKEPP